MYLFAFTKIKYDQKIKRLYSFEIYDVRQVLQKTYFITAICSYWQSSLFDVNIFINDNFFLAINNIFS